MGQTCSVAAKFMESNGKSMTSERHSIGHTHDQALSLARARTPIARGSCKIPRLCLNGHRAPDGSNLTVCLGLHPVAAGWFLPPSVFGREFTVSTGKSERNVIGHTHARASSEQVWVPMASSRSVNSRRQTRTVPYSKPQKGRVARGAWLQEREGHLTVSRSRLHSTMTLCWIASRHCKMVGCKRVYRAST
jgi:hypothetical protein